MRHRAVIGSVCVLLALALGPASAATTPATAPPDPPPPAAAPAKAFERVTAERPVAAAPDVTTLANGGYGFVPITPYRTLDSRRYADGRLFPGDEAYFTVLTDADDFWMIPEEAVAVTYNLTVTSTVGFGGYLAVFPADAVWPGNSSINWFGTGLDLANGGVSAIGFLDGPGEISVYCGGPPGVSTYFIMDITGYYI